MKIVTARDFNQDISQAKRFAGSEPVFVTDRGRPTHVLLSIDAYRQLNGERENILDLSARPAGSAPLVRPERATRPRRRGGALMYLLDTGMLLDLREARRPDSDPALARGRSGFPRSRCSSLR